jgi:hypothetical protein
MKKDGIQTRNRKLSAKSKKKRGSVVDFFSPFDAKSFSYGGMSGMTALTGMGGSGSGGSTGKGCLPQTFFYGGKKISSRGARTYFLPKIQQKTYYFSQKKFKNILFLAGQRSARAPMPVSTLRFQF